MEDRELPGLHHGKVSASRVPVSMQAATSFLGLRSLLVCRTECQIGSLLFVVMFSQLAICPCCRMWLRWQTNGIDKWTGAPCIANRADTDWAGPPCNDSPRQLDNARRHARHSCGAHAVGRVCGNCVRRARSKRGRPEQRRRLVRLALQLACFVRYHPSSSP